MAPKSVEMKCNNKTKQSQNNNKQLFKPQLIIYYKLVGLQELTTIVFSQAVSYMIFLADFCWPLKKYV